MAHVVKTVVLGALLALILGWLWRRWRVAQLSARQQLAILQFADVADQLPDEFLTAAEATGKPRGLHWKQCDLGETRLFAQDRTSGQLCALVGATIRFEAIAGGDMEEVEAVGNLRFGTAIFVHRRGRWTTDGQLVFNLEPAQALEHFQAKLTPLVEAQPVPPPGTRSDR